MPFPAILQGCRRASHRECMSFGYRSTWRCMSMRYWSWRRAKFAFRHCILQIFVKWRLKERNELVERLAII